MAGRLVAARSAPRSLSALAPAVAPSVGRLALQQQARFASSSSVEDPAKRASSLIDSLPGLWAIRCSQPERTRCRGRKPNCAHSRAGNSVVSKTMIVTLGTGATAWALSNEIFIFNAECVDTIAETLG